MTGVRSTAVRAFIAAMSLAASLSLFYGFAHWHSGDTVKFGAYLLAALFASSLKVTLPGIEGTLSQGVRAFGLRQCRYRGLPKTRLQHLAIAAAINIDRLAAWLDGRPHTHTRTSRFAALAT